MQYYVGTLEPCSIFDNYLRKWRILMQKCILNLICKTQLKKMRFSIFLHGCAIYVASNLQKVRIKPNFFHFARVLKCTINADFRTAENM
jgi:hypothetical protein